MSHSACHEVTKSNDKESTKKVDVDDADAKEEPAKKVSDVDEDVD